MSAPLVSVVIPLFNGERFLAETIESVLAQTHRPVETIVVDDGSTDRSAEIAGSYPVTYLDQRNSGVAAARNRGLEAARGEYISLLDQDDVWLPRKLELQVRALERNPDAGLCSCRFETFLEPGCEVPEWVPNSAYVEAATSWRNSQVGTLLVRCAVFGEVGGFDAAYSTAGDVDWFLRARDAGVGVVRIEDCLQHKRIHDRNASAGRDPAERMRAFHASTRRKRAVNG